MSSYLSPVIQHNDQRIFVKGSIKNWLATLTAPNIVIQRAPVTNPSSCMMSAMTEFVLEDEGEMTHDCVTLTYAATSEIAETPIENAELELFVDGSAQVIEGNRRAGYAVTSTTEVVASGRLPDHFSTDNTTEAKGNALAEVAAKQACFYATVQVCSGSTAQKIILPPESIVDLYKDVPLYEAWTWLDKGATVDSSGCWDESQVLKSMVESKIQKRSH